VPRLEDNPEYKRAAQLAKVGPETWKSWVGALAAVASGFKELTKNAPMGSLLRATGLSDTPPSKPSAADMLLSGVDAVTPTAGIFLGQKAKIADLAKLEEARRLLAHKVPAEQVRKQTGWFQGPADKKWRFEISDEAAEFKPNKLGELREFVEARKARNRVVSTIQKNYPELNITSTAALEKNLNNLKNDALLAYLDTNIRFREAKAKLGDSLRVGDLYDHPELFNAYPELAEFVISPRQGYGGALYERGMARPELEVGLGRYEDPSSTMLHELQHGIQGIEDTPRGGSPRVMEALRDKSGSRLKWYENMYRLYELTVVDGMPLNEAVRFMEKTGNFVGTPSDLAAAKNWLLTKQKLGLNATQLKNYISTEHKTHSDILTNVSPDPHQAYLDIAGEYEARKTESRRFMTPEERLSEPPWKDKPPYLHVIH
jgi:hypothetical protein